MSSRLFFDLEFYKDIDGQLLSAAWALDDGPVQSFDMRPLESNDLPGAVEFFAALKDPNIIKVSFTNTDVTWPQKNLGLRVEGELHDARVMAWVVNENTPLDLEWCAKRYCHITMDKRMRQSSNVVYFTDDDGKDWALEDHANWPTHVWDQLVYYNERDVEATRSLYHELRGRMLRQGDWWDYFEYEEMDFTRLLADMESRGLPINLDEAASLRQKLAGDLEQQSAKLAEVLGYSIKWTGRKDMANVLYKDSWYQQDSIPHGLDLKKPTLVQHIVDGTFRPDLDVPPISRTKKSVEDSEVESLKMEIVKVHTPAGFVVQKVTPKNLNGYWVRKGRGLKEIWVKDMETDEWKITTATPNLLASYEHASDEFVQELVKWRKIDKLITTYLDVYPKRTKNGRLMGHYLQGGTVTGRISSSGPNLMNQPSRGSYGALIRHLFQGRFIIGDYSQLEPRVMAHFSQDPRLLEAFAEGQDLYAITAAGVFGGKVSDYDHEHPLRGQAKVIYLGTDYGAGYKKLSMLLNIAGYPTTWDEAKAHLERMENLFSVREEYKKEQVKFARKQGYIETLAGRHRRLSAGFKGRTWKEQGRTERQAVNAKIQGSAADIIRRGMILAEETFGQVFPTLTQVHDEVIWEALPHVSQEEVEAKLPELREVMEVGHGFGLSVPLVFEPTIATTWADKGSTGIDWQDLLEEDIDE